MEQHGLHDVAKLNWNEGLWGPLPGVEAAVAAAFGQVWAYPEFAYNELREAIAAETGARPDQVLPGHGIQALILTLIGAFVAPGDAVVVPSPTYGLYAQASRVAGAHVETVAAPDLRIDLEAIAAAARRTDARIAWVCDPNNPTGARLDPGEWQAFLDALPPGCLAVADEAYTDYIPPAEQPRPRGRHRRRPARRRAAHVLQDLRPRRPAARLPARRPGAAALPPARAGAVQRQPRGARGRRGQPRPPGRRRGAARRRDRRARAARGGPDGRRHAPAAVRGELPARRSRRRRRRPDGPAAGARRADPARRRARPARLRAHHRRAAAGDGPRGGGAAGRAARSWCDARSSARSSASAARSPRTRSGRSRWRSTRPTAAIPPRCGRRRPDWA